MDNLIIVAAAIVVVIVLILITGYVKAPTDTAVIISGLKKEPKYVIGRSSIKIPFLQRTDKLTLKMISVDVKTEESVPTNDYINVNIDSAVKVKVSMDPEKMKLAASNFLNKNEEYKEQEQRKTIEIATADANIAKQEKEAEIKEKEIAVREKSLDAEVKKQADAEKYARMQKADAEKYEQEKRAEAEKFTKLQAAEATRAQYEAEAEGIRAKGLAEAEAMEKKADAMAKYGKAAMTEMIIKVLPQMAEAIAKPLESIDKVSIIGGAGDSGMSAISDNVPQVLAKTIESVKETTGFDLTEVMKANTYDAKVNNNINVATDFGEKITENAVKETTAEMHKNKIPSDSKDECFDYENM